MSPAIAPIIWNAPISIETTTIALKIRGTILGGGVAKLVEGGGLENVPTSVVLRVFYRLASSVNGIHGIIRACSPFNVQLNMQPCNQRTPCKKQPGTLGSEYATGDATALLLPLEDRLATVGVTPFSERLAGTPKTCEVASEGAGEIHGLWGESGTKLLDF